VFIANGISDERIVHDRDNCGLELVIPDKKLQSKFMSQFEMFFEEANAESTLTSGSEDDVSLYILFNSKKTHTFHSC